ncbi:MAG: thioredoxin [Methanomicrobiales archaeon]|nr:thioredoxin [Methanomicrobiales archaeon]
MDEDLDAARKKRMQEIERSVKKKENPGVMVITESLFQETLKKESRLVVDFWAEWCGPCRMVGPAIEELALEFSGKVTFGKCNTDENPRIAQRMNIAAIPTIMLFSQGKMVERIIGAYPKEVIRSKIMRAFNLAA